VVDLRGYVRAIRKNWWIVVACVLLGAGAATFMNLRATPQYQSKVEFFVSTPTADGGNALQADQYAQRRVNSYVGLLTSERLAERVLADTGLTRSVASVQRSISASADLNTVLLSATVTDSSPDASLAIASAVANDLGPLVDQYDDRGDGSANVELNVISGPTLNSTPVSPKTKTNLALGLAAGLVVGIVLALLRELSDTSVRSPNALQSLTGRPVLGVLNYDRRAKRAPLELDSRARSVRAEAFRQLRTNLQFVDLGSPVHVLVVTSSVADEGKSSTAVNLAVAIADSGRSVVLIEADLRRPRVAEYLGLESSVGLTNVLVGQAQVEDVLQPWGRGALTVLPCGTIAPNPSELLGSPEMSRLLERLRERFDVVVLDTPPLLPVTDAAVAAAQADGALLVVRHGKTSRNQITQSLESLEAVGARTLGTVLNMVPTRGADKHASFGYGYYEDRKRTRRPDASAADATTPTGEPGSRMRERVDPADIAAGDRPV
jgi:capsular exopolysaccharide synthesis family protein